MYDFIRGPLALISFSVFIFGSLFQVIRFYRMSQKIPLRDLAAIIGHHRPKADRRFSLHKICNQILRFQATILGINPAMAVVTTIFHVCIFIIPLFLAGHNILLDESWGISFWELPEKITDRLTIILLACVLFFLIRRISLARVRVLTTFEDYFILFFVAAPYITGYLAYHQIFDYRTLIMLHMLAGEFFLIMIPFSKPVHMFCFFLNRAIVGSEYSFVRGGRRW